MKRSKRGEIIFKETISGAKMVRPELSKMIEQFRQGVELVVWRLDRLGRSLKYIIDLVIKHRKKFIKDFN
ncbi:recombinase family protein [Pedobacter sp. R20-19]|uniref:recombinase family protein n=1 Tax=Pedobacter sp. R20-19 TaxID=1270196 RepID=UPI0006892639